MANDAARDISPERLATLEAELRELQESTPAIVIRARSTVDIRCAERRAGALVETPER